MIDTLILDYSKWICGEDGIAPLGKGHTFLLNSEGYMCCLGQWLLQLGADEREILGFGEPNEVQVEYAPLSYIDDGGRMRDSAFSREAMQINDNTHTTPVRKIEKLKDLCAGEGIKLVVINQPQEVENDT